MSMYKHIILPIDGSPNADEAARHAIDLAGRYDAQLHVLHVVDTHRYSEPALSSTELVIESLEADGGEILTRLVERAEAAGLDVESRLCHGRPSSEIVEYAETVEEGLVVIGAQGHTHDRPGQIGGVANRVLRTSPRPVLIV